MREQTFYDWLTREVASSRMALVNLYEARDKLLYVEAPKLRAQYMDLIGGAENPVLEAELEVSMLRRKLELIRIAVNRREPLDMEKIDAVLEEEKKQKVTEVENSDLTLQELPNLTEEQQRTMQRRYKEITSVFHPAIHADLTEAQRTLYEKAVEAYQMQDAEAMRIIYEALFPAEDMEMDLCVENVRQEDPREDYRRMARALSIDYFLAKKLYDCFLPLEEDRVVLDTLHTCDARSREVQDEIEKIRQGFPFNAAETMSDPEKTAEYLEELRFRGRQCEEEKRELERKIEELVKEYANV